jgi:hypothetical protein
VLAQQPRNKLEIEGGADFFAPVKFKQASFQFSPSQRWLEFVGGSVACMNSSGRGIKMHSVLTL